MINSYVQPIVSNNQPIMDALMNAKKVAESLCNQGFRILDINIGPRNPRIIINPSGRCRKLDGAQIKRTKLSRAVIITMSASIDGVQVEWMVPENG